MGEGEDNMELGFKGVISKAIFMGDGVTTSFSLTGMTFDRNLQLFVYKKNTTVNPIIVDKQYLSVHYSLTGDPAATINFFAPPLATDEITVEADDRLFPKAVEDHVIGWDHTATELENKNINPQIWDETFRGPQGYPGPQGPIGMQGPQGPAGINGTNGVYDSSNLATQAAAELGSDNASLMTPLRVMESLQFNLPLLLASNSTFANLLVDFADHVLANDAKFVALDAQISDLQNRVGILESLSDDSWIVGSHFCGNGATGQIDGDGSNNGRPLSFDGDSTNAVWLLLDIQRKDDLELRIATIELVMHFINGAWMIEEIKSTNMEENNHGMSFTVTDLGNNVGIVTYTSDFMSGGNYDGSFSKIRYISRRIQVDL